MSKRNSIETHTTDDTEISLAAYQQDKEDKRSDHFVKKDGNVFAGTHLLVDLWGAQKIDDLKHVESAIREAVIASQATLLHIHLHHFTPNGGISGVAVLAESHISVHSWPERQYVAFDVFMCGRAQPEQTIDVFKRYFTPEKMDIKTLLRGQL